MPAEIVKAYLDKNYRIVIWPQIGDAKGPQGKEGKGWTEKVYNLQDYKEGYRVGILLGTETSPGKFLHDVDIDWQPGSIIAQKLLPGTNFVFGRSSKRVSHCFYLLSEPLPIYKYTDVDKTTLIELRGTEINGSLGHQTMVPPSVWTKDGKKEDLEFIKFEEPSYIDNCPFFKQRVCLSAIGMIIAKHLGKNGFGHDARLAWAGFLLRAGISIDDLVIMGQAISTVTNNIEIEDVRRVVESTASRLTADSIQKIKGGPALAKIIGTQGKAVIARINEWLGRDSDFLRNSDGLIIKDSQENIKRALQLLEIDISNQEFSEKLLLKEGDKATEVLGDVAITDLWLRIDRDYRFRPSYAFFEKVVTNLASANSFHPVRDYLRSLLWDNTPRINEWLIKYGQAKDTQYCRAISAIMLIAAVRRIFQPGCKYDEMVVLESAQGLNKSSALRALCPHNDWFSDDLPLNVDAKQIIERTLGKWIIEASDLTGGRKADRDHLKSMLSRQVDGPARMAYAHFPVERARQFIIVGTTNSAAYLADMTGARRFWPVTVKRFDTDGIQFDRDQLWAEAVKRESDGESIRLPESLWNAAGEEQDSRREVDAWEGVIEEHLPLLKQMGDGRKQVTTDKLWEILGITVAGRDRLSSMRISEIMQRLGFTRTKIRADGRVQAGYIGPQENLNLGEEKDR